MRRVVWISGLVALRGQKLRHRGRIIEPLVFLRIGRLRLADVQLANYR